MMDISRNHVILDYDGVCTDGHTGFLSATPDGYSYSERCVGLVEELCRRTDSAIIISSNWRKFDEDGFWIHDGGRYRNPLPKLKERLGGLIAASFPVARGKSKSEAFSMFIEEHGIDIDSFNFVILEDDVREGYQHLWFARERLVMTDGSLGFTEENMERAVEILKGKHS